MQVTAMLCDHAQVSSDGKLFISGAGICRVQTPNAEPPMSASFSLAVLIQIDWTETNMPHTFCVELVYDDPSGAQVVPIPVDTAPGAPEEAKGRFYGEFNAGRGPDMLAGEATLMPLALNMPGLELPAPGSYFFSVKIDGEEQGRAQFRLTVNTPMFMGGGFGR